MPLVAQQQHLGRTLAIVRDYRFIGQRFPDGKERAVMARGSTLLVSLDTTSRQTYAQVTAGGYDAQITGFLRAMQAAAVQYQLGAIYICFEHEANIPGTHRGTGSPAQFLAAWDHVHTLATRAGLDWQQGGRLHWVLILSHMAYAPLAGRPPWARDEGWIGDFWPGQGEADIVAADGYNRQDCDYTGGRWTGVGVPQAMPSQLFGPVLAFAARAGGKPVFIAEFGSIPYQDPAVQAGWITSMQAYVLANPKIAAVSYWDDTHPTDPCGFKVDGHPLSLAALAAMGRVFTGTTG